MSFAKAHYRPRKDRGWYFDAIEAREANRDLSSRFRRDLEPDALIRQKRVKRSLKRFGDDDEDYEGAENLKRKREWRKRITKKRDDEQDEFDFDEIRELLAREELRRMIEDEKRSYRRRKRN
ncbi:DgyrCDS6956 [Dimorphilus gyrociliatus]|uniref:DgyrCDS6956 n=1 Tax=Dimorphilus gyrociliatus TaxID=2664684 RepID=A0A7I8VPJ3_9ANNE|nr:DgyrCDS6956 [Dimorphilus gyrociliatus]